MCIRDSPPSESLAPGPPLLTWYRHRYPRRHLFEIARRCQHHLNRESHRTDVHAKTMRKIDYDPLDIDALKKSYPKCH
eukprot:11190765-Prorocentrum_lima.AAC.1